MVHPQKPKKEKLLKPLRGLVVEYVCSEKTAVDRADIVVPTRSALEMSETLEGRVFFGRKT